MLFFVFFSFFFSPPPFPLACGVDAGGVFFPLGFLFFVPALAAVFAATTLSCLFFPFPFPFPFASLAEAVGAGLCASQIGCTDCTWNAQSVD